MKTTHHGITENGIFTPDDRTAHISALGALQGKRTTMTLERFRKARSGRQNRYYWGIIIKAIQEAGGYTTPDEAHDACRWALLRVEREKGPYCRSTTELTTIETEDYYSKLRQMGAEGFFGDSVWIPEPNQTDFDYTLEA